jgi:hypothetical protein
MNNILEGIGFLFIAAGLVMALFALPALDSPFLWAGVVVVILGIYLIYLARSKTRKADPALLHDNGNDGPDLPTPRREEACPPSRICRSDADGGFAVDDGD